MNSGDRVKDRQGIQFVVLGTGEVTVNDEPYEVAEVEVIEDHVGPGDRVTLRGTKMLRYTVDLYAAESEFVVEMAYNFRSVVKADSEDAARETLREALVEALTFDGDENAPQPLEDLEMRQIDAVPA